MVNFTKIFILRKPGEDEKTQQVCELIENFAEKSHIPVEYSYPNNVSEKILFISVGGDGTMLGAMRSSLNYPASSILGLNTGSLGFLTEEVPAEFKNYLNNILFNTDVIFDERMILSGKYFINGEEQEKTLDAINEFTLTGKSTNSPVVTEIYINDKFVSRQMGTGVLVGTSTGSTAMSLSAGGAIISPSTKVIQIVSLMSHTLTSRPIISSGRDNITIRTVLDERIKNININADGQLLKNFNTVAGTEIKFTIEKHETSVKIWRPKDWNFFDVLAEKMKW